MGKYISWQNIAMAFITVSMVVTGWFMSQLFNWQERIEQRLNDKVSMSYYAEQKAEMKEQLKDIKTQLAAVNDNMQKLIGQHDRMARDTAAHNSAMLTPSRSRYNE